MKKDIRVTITKKIMKDSLLSLMKIKPFKKISVKDICDSSDISRATFYAHYSDIYDLLADFERDIFISYTDSDFTSEPSLLYSILSSIDKNSEFYKIYFDNFYDSSITDLINNWRYKIITSWLENKVFSTEEEASFAFIFYKNGIVGIIKEWLNEDIKERKTPEMIADIINNILTISPTFVKI